MASGARDSRLIGMLSVQAMKARALQWRAQYGDMVANAGSLVGTQAITSGLGFFYWWLAARHYAPEAVGLASAAISAMMLLGTASILGLGTLLIGELPRQPAGRTALITTALLVSAAAGSLSGLLFARLAPALAADLGVLAAGWGASLLFAFGVALTAVSMVLDQAVIGLLRGELQLWRNGVQAAAKLAILALAASWWADRQGLTIYATWVLGGLISLAALAAHAAFGRRPFEGGIWPKWSFVTRLGRAALQHHALNLALQAAALILPIVVTALLSARLNAYYYTAWMIAGFAFVVPASLTTVLYAVGAASPASLAHKARMTLRLSAGLSLLAVLVVWMAGDWVLNLFHPHYAEQAGWTLRLLVLGVFPQVVRSHFVAWCRIHGRVGKAALWMAGAGLLELSLAALGAHLGGLTGLSLGWLMAVSLGALFQAPIVARLARGDSEAAASYGAGQPKKPVHLPWLGRLHRPFVIALVLGLIALAEGLSAWVAVEAGQAAGLLTLTLLFGLAGFHPSQKIRHLSLAVTLIPLARLLGATLTDSGLDPLSRTMVMSLALLAGAVVASRELGLPRLGLGQEAFRPLVYLGLLVTAPFLGWLGAGLIQPAALLAVEAQSPSMVVALELVCLVGGLAEGMILFGLILAAARNLVGDWPAVAFVAGLAALLQLPLLSWAGILFALALVAGYGWVAIKTRSTLAVALAYGMVTVYCYINPLILISGA